MQSIVLKFQMPCNHLVNGILYKDYNWDSNRIAFNRFRLSTVTMLRNFFFLFTFLLFLFNSQSRKFEFSPDFDNFMQKQDEQCCRWQQHKYKHVRLHSCSCACFRSRFECLRSPFYLIFIVNNFDNDSEMATKWAIKWTVHLKWMK